MSKNRLFILTMGIGLVLACTLTVGAPTAVPTAVPQSLDTQTPLPTYTPYPTYTAQAETTVIVEVEATRVEVVTATLPPTPERPPLSDKLVRPNETYNGTTLNAAEMLYFNGRQGQYATIILTGVSHYQTFTIRDEDNDGLVGCKIDSQVACSIERFQLPYTGFYYILVDRTRDPRYENNSYCKNKGALAPPWCFISGPYSLVLTLD
ncbi:MAG: hypothetical protein AB1750_16395 [Chloroflexota bacterium]